MTNPRRREPMPVTLRVAFTILGVVTALAGGMLLAIALFLWVWGGWLGLLPLALTVAYVTVLVLVMIRKSWARFATPLFPVSFAIAAVSSGARDTVLLALIAGAVVTLAAVVLVFAPSSRVYFGPRPVAEPRGVGPADAR